MGVPDGWSPRAPALTESGLQAGSFAPRRQHEEDGVNSRRYLRRSLVSSLLLRLLVLALVYLTLQLIEPASPEDEAADAPSPTAAPEAGVVSDEFEQTIEVQTRKKLGRDTQVTCPDRIELIQGNQVTCLISEATDQAAPVGTPIADAAVTITGDPGESGRVAWKWTAVEPSVSGMTPEPVDPAASATP